MHKIFHHTLYSPTFRAAEIVTELGCTAISLLLFRLNIDGETGDESGDGVNRVVEVNGLGVVVVVVVVDGVVDQDVDCAVVVRVIVDCVVFGVVAADVVVPLVVVVVIVFVVVEGDVVPFDVVLGDDCMGMGFVGFG